MAKIEFFKTNSTYNKSGSDEWKETYEYFTYIFDTEDESISEIRVCGFDNARDASENYEKPTFPRHIEFSKLPLEAQKKLDEIRNSTSA